MAVPIEDVFPVGVTIELLDAVTDEMGVDASFPWSDRSSALPAFGFHPRNPSSPHLVSMVRQFEWSPPRRD